MVCVWFLDTRHKQQSSKDNQSHSRCCPAHNTYSGGTVNIYAVCRVSECVLKSQGELLHHEMAYTLSFCYGPVKGLSVRPRAVEPGEDNIDIHAARSDGVTSGHLIPQLSVITVSLVAGEM